MNKFLSKENLNELFRYAMALTGSKQDAEDLLHTGLERGLKQNLPSIQNKNAFLRTIMRNFWYDELRKNKVRKDHLLAQTACDTDPVEFSEPMADKILIDEIQLQRSWLKLKEQQRELLYLWCILDMTAAEIAAELRVPRGTVLSRLHRLKRELQSSPIATANHSSEVQHD